MNIQQADETNTNTHSHWQMAPRTRITLCFFLGIAAVFLLVEHWQHVWPFLPYALLVPCPLMHIFMHHGHGDHKMSGQDMAGMRHSDGGSPTSTDSQEEHH